MKQFDPIEEQVGGHIFSIFPFPAFKAANLSGEIAALVAPMLEGIAKLAVGNENALNIFDSDVEHIAPVITGAFSALSGDKVENLLKKILVSSRNVSVEYNGETQYLTEDLANDLFCGNVQDMYILAFKVIKFNYAGFFEKLGSLFGTVAEKTQVAKKTSNNTGA